MWSDASPHALTMGNDIAIRAVGISKRYRAGQRGRYRNLRDAIAGAFSVFGRRGPTSACAAASGTTHAPATDAHGYFWALKDVSFEVKLGEAVGIIGPNGAGKSTLLKILGRVTRPTAGYADVTGRVGSLFEVGTGFNSELSGRENVYLSGAILGMKKKQIDRKFDQIVAFADIEPFLDTAVKYYSTGMFVRIAFAVAAHLDTDILLVDDVLAVGDAGFREKCLRKMEAVIGEGRTVVLVSHDMTTVNALCGRTLRMEHGLLVPPRAGLFPPDGARRTGAGVVLDSARGPARRRRVAMRVLCWSETFWPRIGGVEILTAQLLQALGARGYEFVVVTPDTEWRTHGDDHYNGVPVHRFPFQSALASQQVERVWQLRTQVAQIKRRFAPDLVHINALGSSAIFQHWTAEAWRVPCLLTVHSTCGEDNLQHDTLLGHTVRSANWVTAVSSAVLAELHRLVPEVRERSSVIHNAVAMPAQSSASLPIDPPRLLCLGRLVSEKGFDLALTALAALRPRFPHLRMTIAGDGVDRGDLEERAARLNLLDIVEFVGWVAPENVPALINSATIVVIPSRREGLPLAGLQAALMARPVVGTRVGGLAELVASEQTGLLVDTEDSAGLAEAITRLLQCGKLAVQMGEAARARAEGCFGWQRCVDAYDALYQQLVKGG